ncbi:MAG TPA: ABC transporter permease [Gaiellaceae bacterium]|nr:ABC transporter permease [Gaiellaceae bacterium]
MDDLLTAGPSAEERDAVEAESVAARGAPRAALLRRRLLRSSAFWIGLIDLLLMLVFWWLSPHHLFLSKQSILALLTDGAAIVLMTGGVACLMATGEFDISLGANLILSSVVGAKVMTSGLGLGTGIALGVVTSIAVGGGVGLVNGLIVTKLRVNSLITTLATLGIATGLAELLTGGSDISSIPLSLQNRYGSATLWGVIPYPAVVTAILLAVAWFIMNKTRIGLRAIAIGSSRLAASRAGLEISRILIVMFVIAGLGAGVSGVTDLARFATTNIAGHQLDALAAITGVVIGGTRFGGGAISIGGAIFGAFMSVILDSGLVVLGLPPYYQLIVVGGILLAAVAINIRRTGEEVR